MKLLRQHLVSSYELAPHFSQAEGLQIEAATASLVAAALRGNNPLPEQTPATPMREVLCYQIKRHIRENLGSDDLSPGGISLAFGISRAQLYRLTEPVGGVANYIRELRLRRCMEQIGDRRFAGQQIAEIAYCAGFKHAATFNRSFRRAFGMTPGEARERGYASVPFVLSEKDDDALHARSDHHQWFNAMGI